MISNIEDMKERKITMEERTERVLTIKFDGDFEYLYFIKILASSSHLKTMTHIKDFWEKGYAQILENEELSEMYNQIK